MSKLISTFKIGFDDETKAEIAALKSSLDAITGTLGLPSALLGSTKPNGGLLNAMGEAANDASEPELLQLGQWVFDGCDPKWVSAVIQPDGQASRCNFPIKNLMPGEWGGWIPNHFLRLEFDPINGCFDAAKWQDGAIDRQPTNDVEYLSETSEINVMEASDIIVDEMGRDYSHNSNCLHAVVPEITQGDRQHIFIKNLSDVLIQRMRSMDRFSEDDYHVGGEKLMRWDILIYEPLSAYAILLDCPTECNVTSLLFFSNNSVEVDTEWETKSAAFKILRTITEDETLAFRATLEACYV